MKVLLFLFLYKILFMCSYQRRGFHHSQVTTMFMYKATDSFVTWNERWGVGAYVRCDLPANVINILEEESIEHM